jgi:hypothetical protein
MAVRASGLPARRFVRLIFPSKENSGLSFHSGGNRFDFIFHALNLLLNSLHLVIYHVLELARQNSILKHAHPGIQHISDSHHIALNAFNLAFEEVDSLNQPASHYVALYFFQRPAGGIAYPAGRVAYSSRRVAYSAFNVVKVSHRFCSFRYHQPSAARSACERVKLISNCAVRLTRQVLRSSKLVRVSLAG